MTSLSRVISFGAFSYCLLLIISEAYTPEVQDLEVVGNLPTFHYELDERKQQSAPTFVSPSESVERKQRSTPISLSPSIPDVSQYKTYLSDNRNLPLTEFKNLYSSEKSQLEEVAFDPLKAQYYDMFMDAKKRPVKDHGTHADLSLTRDQINAFRKYGFVVTEEEHSMGIAYYKIFNNDLPVLITTDSILHAFHKSYDTMLEDLEQNIFIASLSNIFEGMRTALKDAAGKFTTGPLQQSFHDIDLFLTVGANLLYAEEYYIPKQETIRYDSNTQGAMVPTLFSGNDEVEKALQICRSAGIYTIEIFGQQRTVDFSLFTPRGHYAKSAKLRQYFRAMNWLGEIDMKIRRGGSIREVGAAVVLRILLNADKHKDDFRDFMTAIDSFVGPSNSLDMHQFGHFMNKLFDAQNFEAMNTIESLEKIRDELLKTKLGQKAYNSDIGDTRSLTFMGKKFALDGWAQYQLVNNLPERPIEWNGDTVDRHTTSSVEVAFSVLANNDSIPIIYERMLDNDSEYPFRDGLIYHHHLVAARKTVDFLPDEAWSSSLYMLWLRALRTLSAPMDERFPQAMRTQAFGMKKLNTQLGSWAQLRHDNILYVEQPRRSLSECDYPEGYVEPFVEFWAAIENMCNAVIEVVDTFPVGMTGRLTGSPVKLFTYFKQQVEILRKISMLELENRPLSPEQASFLKNVVEKHETFGSGSSVTWHGWYPSLFYGGAADVVNPDLIACDTFTNPPNLRNAGSVVHQALGYPRRMLMAVDNGGRSTVYAGPVFGFYEFELPGVERMSDEMWAEKVKKQENPPPPEWTNSFLIPK